ncbi:MAG: AAA family ATPase, partial [Planctomycetota bacterium]
MEGSRLLRTLRLTNFLSYGPDAEEIELQPLNVLIGPNGSGKSNLIQAIGLLKAAPSNRSIAGAIQGSGGLPEWSYKYSGGSPSIDFEIETTLSYPHGALPLRYGFHVIRSGQGLEIDREIIENEGILGPDEADACFFYRHQEGKAVLNVREQVDAPAGTSIGRIERQLKRGDLNLALSVLAQRKDPDTYPELTYLSGILPEIQMFRSCNIGPGSLLLGPQGANEPAGFLLENGRNLGMVLNDLLSRLPVKRRILQELKQFYEYVEDISQKVGLNTIETLFHEGEGGYVTIPSSRLSDGTMRYLCLLAILCHPVPPPLVCIEDPEIALHPDALPRLADLLVEASQNTQLVVTT